MATLKFLVVKVAICLDHKIVDGMADRILKVYPDCQTVNIDAKNCVACLGKV